MKISIVSILTGAFALTLSFTSFAADKKKNKEEKETASAVTFDAALYKIGDTNKVRLSVDKNANERLRVVLKDKAGKIYYSEVFNARDTKYRRVFNLDEMNDGTYYFEMSHKKDKKVKEVNIESTNSKMISLQ
jgi:lipopolysaccharide export LptBFGC system permease protein LptF